MAHALGSLPVSEYLGYVSEDLLKVLPAGYEDRYPNIKASLDLIFGRDMYKTKEGQYFAVQRTLEGAEPYIDYIQSIYYRRDLASSAGVTIKDAYTMDELFDMYTAVQAAYPDMLMFNSIWPDNVKQLGLVEGVPEIVVSSSLNILSELNSDLK